MLIKIVKRQGADVNLYEADNMRVLQNIEEGKSALEITKGASVQTVTLTNGEAVVYVMGDSGKTLDTYRP